MAGTVVNETGSVAQTVLLGQLLLFLHDFLEDLLLCKSCCGLL